GSSQLPPKAEANMEGRASQRKSTPSRGNMPAETANRQGLGALLARGAGGPLVARLPAGGGGAGGRMARPGGATWPAVGRSGEGERDQGRHGRQVVDLGGLNRLGRLPP